MGWPSASPAMFAPSALSAHADDDRDDVTPLRSGKDAIPLSSVATVSHVDAGPDESGGVSDLLGGHVEPPTVNARPSLGTGRARSTSRR